MRAYLAREATLRGHRVIDMHGLFDRHYKVHRTRFEYEHDLHWNGLAHGLAAEAVRESGVRSPGLERR